MRVIPGPSGNGSSVLLDAIRLLSTGQDLDEPGTVSVIEEIMAGRATSAQIAAFLVALRVKGETEIEIAGAAGVLRRWMTSVEKPAGPVIDTCGTGGDGLQTFNISTAAAFVVAGAGVAVAKHGNRSVSSRCGSADVVEALGIPQHAEPERLAAQLVRHRLCFLFAPHLHPAMRHAAGPRREIGIRTIFNLIGPLANPAGVTHQLLGVSDPRRVPVLARVLGRLGAERAWVVCGEDGMDELTTTGPCRVARLQDGNLELETIEPTVLGLPRARAEDLRGGDAKENARRIESVLEGETGPARDVVLLNSAAALVVAGRADGLVEGLRRAASSLDDGRALAVLQALRRRPASREEG